MAFGLTQNGFNRKRLADIKVELETAYKAIFGNNIDLSPQSVFGQIIGIHSEREADLWEQAELVYNAFYPATANGVQLENLVTLNGIVRQKSTKSTVKIVCSGTDGTVIEKGSIVSTSDTKEQFVSVTYGKIENGSATIQFNSANVGAVEAIAGTLTKIETPIFGWHSAINMDDAEIGQSEETDAELRDRRTKSTRALGRNLQDSLFGQISDIDNVESALVISNGTDNIDANGIPAHQFLVVVDGGDDKEIAKTIWLNTPQGISSHGALTETIIDSQGFKQLIKYSRPVDREIYLNITIATDEKFPSTGESDIKSAIVEFGNNNFGIGDTVFLSKFYTPINSINGVTSIDLKIGLTQNNVSASDIKITVEEISKYDTARIVILMS